MHDLIIIGAGPAGITAAVYAARKRIDFLVITGDIGGQTAWSGAIENYTGYQFITGPDLTAKFEEHMRTYNVPLREGEEVSLLAADGDAITVRTGKGTYRAKAVIVASGKRSRELGVPGEKEYKNKGLTYCATCDGPLFSGKDVAVIGGGNSALDAALQLVRIARKVHLINIADHLTGDPVMREKLTTSPIVTIRNSAVVTKVSGDAMVRSITVRSGATEESIPVEGVFVEVGLIPNTAFVPGVEKNDRGEIRVDARNRTNISGIFAAGDVTDVPEKQIVIAAGEGAKAALSVFRFLSQRV